jgi:hypothetical protein
MVVQDFRELNQKLDRQTITFKYTEETLGPIEAEKLQIFSMLDLSRPAWQLLLMPQQQEVTAFSFPGWGQFQWVVAPPQGLRLLTDHVPSTPLDADEWGIEQKVCFPN